MPLPPPDLPTCTKESAASLPTAVADDQPATASRTTNRPPPAESADIMPESWPGIFWDALRYPLHRQGWIMLILAGAVGFLTSLAMMFPIIGWCTALGGAAYLAAYYLEIVQHTITGKNQLPEYPAITSLSDDILIPGMQMLCIGLVSSVPFMAYAFFSGGDETSLVYHFVELFSSAYFPMAVLGVVSTGTLSATLPHRVIPNIIRCLPGYLVPVVALAFVGFAVEATLAWVIEKLNSSLGLSLLNEFWLQPGVLWLVVAYVTFFDARLAGLVGRRFETKMTW